MRQTYEPGLDFDPVRLKLWIDHELYPYVKKLFTDNFNLPFASESLGLDGCECIEVTFSPTVDWHTLGRHLATVPQGQYRVLAKSFNG